MGVGSGRGGTKDLFFTTVRKIEPIGGDCIRIYCAIEKNGGWEDCFTILTPITSALANSRFVMESAREILSESRALPEIKLEEKLQTH